MPPPLRPHQAAIYLLSGCGKNDQSRVGELVLAYEYLEQGMALNDPQQHRSHAFLYGQDPRLMYLAHLAVTLWLLGYPERARQRSHELLTLIQELSHPLRLSNALPLAAMLH
jgi:hypothetical protein